MNNSTKRNRVLILTGTALIIFFSLYASTYFLGKANVNKGNIANRISSKLFDFNELKIEFDSIDISKVTITQKNSGKNIFINGEKKKGIKNEYGWCTFNIHYGGTESYEISHFKKSSWHTNEYSFYFYKNNNEFDVILTIEGPDKNNEMVYKKIVPFKEGKKKVYYYDRDKKLYYEEEK